MVKYFAVAVCGNGTHNRPDLAYFAFPEDNARRRKWIVFCKRAGKKVQEPCRSDDLFPTYILRKWT